FVGLGFGLFRLGRSGVLGGFVVVLGVFFGYPLFLGLRLGFFRRLLFLPFRVFQLFLGLIGIEEQDGALDLLILHFHKFAEKVDDLVFEQGNPDLRHRLRVVHVIFDNLLLLARELARSGRERPVDLVLRDLN